MQTLCTLKTMDLFSGIPNLSFTILPMFNLRGKVDYNQSFIYLEYRPVRQKGHHDGRKFHPISYNVRHRSALAIIFAHHSFGISAAWQPHCQLVPLAAQVHHRAIHLKTIRSPNWPTTKQHVEPDVHSCQHVLQWERRGSPASEGPASHFSAACQARKIIWDWRTWGSTWSGFHLSIPTIHLPPEAFRGSSQSGKIPSWESEVVKY